MKDSSEVYKWLVSPRERIQHVDNYKCKVYLSFSETVGGMTALHLACLHNRHSIIKMLLEAGAGEEL